MTISGGEGSGTTPDWYADPTGRNQLRYWDGSRWTEHVSNGGVSSTDPTEVPTPPAGRADQPPQYAQPQYAQPQYAQPQYAQPQYGQPQYGQPQYGPPHVYGAYPQRAAQSLRGLSTALTVLLAISALASLGFAVALFNRVSLTGDILDASFQEVQDADDAVAGTGVLVLLCAAATGVVFIVWQFRHAKNARLLGQRNGLSPGWAIGGWFIPLGSLVLPQLQLHQAARASDPTSPGGGFAPPIVAVWWVLFVVNWLINVGSGRFGGEDLEDLSNLEEFRSADRLAAIGGLVTIVAAIVTIVMVRALTARQHQTLAQRGLLQ